MQIKVKSAKVGKTGENKNGKWELIVVTSEDGTDYTTFHKGAKSLQAETVIDIGEPIIKEGKISFKEYQIISEPAVQSSKNGQPGMTPEAWAEKDRLERWSRECNTCFMGIMELAKTQDHTIGTFGNVYAAALDWALAHFKTTPPVTKPAPAATRPTTGASELKTGSLVFANPGEFYSTCLKQFKVQKSKVDEIIAGAIDLTTDEGRIKAWEVIMSIYGPDEKYTIDQDKLFE